MTVVRTDPYQNTATSAPQEPEAAPARAAESGANVGQAERLVSVAGGAALAYYALRSRAVPGALLALAGGALVYRGATGHCPAYQGLGVSTAQPDAGRGIRVERSVTIHRSAEELYTFWRQLHNLPRFMDHLVSVSVLDAKKSHWVAKAPLGRTVEWDAEIIEEQPGRLLAWRSLPGAEVENTGEVRFQMAPGGRGTELHVTLEYRPPAGAIGATVARVLGEEPHGQVADDLRRLKSILEAGEIPTTRGQSSGRKERSE